MKIQRRTSSRSLHFITLATPFSNKYNTLISLILNLSGNIQTKTGSGNSTNLYVSCHDNLGALASQMKYERLGNEVYILGGDFNAKTFLKYCHTRMRITMDFIEDPDLSQTQNRSQLREQCFHF